MVPMEACGGSGGQLRRSVSEPTLDGLVDAALRLETTPCSVLELHALQDDVARSLQATLAEVQRELRAAVAAGVLRNGGAHDGSDSGEGGSDGEGGSRRRSGGSDRQRSSSADAGGTSAEASGELADELELAGLSAREREAAIKRARNRAAARRSRERKNERICALRGEEARLRRNNFVLLRCIEEVATKALFARAEGAQLSERLASLSAQQQRAARALPGGGCTPPAARRAAALERELLMLEAAPRSPTQLLPPLWPDDGDLPALAAAPPRRLPTSAELRRELCEAVAGCSDGGGSGGAAAAVHHHLLHPSPSAGPVAPLGVQPHLRQLPLQLPQHAAVLHLKQGGPLARTCSAPGALLVQAADDARPAADVPRHWSRQAVA